MKILNIYFLNHLIFILLFYFVLSCKKKENLPAPTAKYVFAGKNYKVSRFNCQNYYFLVPNPKFGQPGEPANLQSTGYKITFTTVADDPKTILSDEYDLNLYITKQKTGIFDTTFTEFSRGMQYDFLYNDSLIQNDFLSTLDSSWINITSVHSKNKTMSGSFQIKDGKLTGVDAITLGEFTDIRIP